MAKVDVAEPPYAAEKRVTKYAPNVPLPAVVGDAKQFSEVEVISVEELDLLSPTLRVRKPKK